MRKRGLTTTPNGMTNAEYRIMNVERAESRSLQVASRDRTEAEAKVERPAFPFHHPGREKRDFPTPISILVSH